MPEKKLKRKQFFDKFVYLTVSFIFVVVFMLGTKTTTFENNKVVERNYFNKEIVKQYSVEEYVKKYKVDQMTLEKIKKDTEKFKKGE